MPDDAGPQPAIHLVWEKLVADSTRLELVARDLRSAIERGRFPLVISERKEHLALLSRVPTNIVEGCAWNSERDCRHFVDMAIASAAEVRYLLGLSARLGILKKADQEPLVRKYDDLIRSVQKPLISLRNPKPGA